MDPRLLHYYNRELQHVRETCGEFAKDYPKIAGRLGLESFECADPYVERLIEGFAYMAARVQLKVDAEFPGFTQRLLDMVYPDYLAPMPSVGIVQFAPDIQGTLNEGVVLPRDTVLRSLLGKGAQTPCEYRTAHDVTLWPIALSACRYLGSTAHVGARGIAELHGVKAALQLRLQTTAGVSFDKLTLDAFTLYLRGGDPVGTRLYEQLVANVVAVVVQPTRGDDKWREVISKPIIRPLGFDDEQALLPGGLRSFHGHRVLREYFAFAERFMFIELNLGAALRRCGDTEVEVLVLFDRAAPLLVDAVDASRFALFCTPAINLFPKRTDRIHISGRQNEFHVVPDRSRPLDFEVYGITSVVGYGTGNAPECAFSPFYACSDATDFRQHGAYYTVQREQRVVSSRQRRVGPRTSYIGNETFVALVDADEAPFRSELRQLAIEALCTNRDLPLDMPVGVGKTDLTLDIHAPVQSVRFVAGPTEPRPTIANREMAWRLISHLSLNYLSLADTDDRQGAAALREILGLYAVAHDPATQKQIDGVRSIVAKPIHRRLPSPGPVTFGRGLEVALTFDEGAFEGTGAFLLGSVLARFFARYVSINSFTETVLKTQSRGEIMRWPAKMGQRRAL